MLRLPEPGAGSRPAPGPTASGSPVGLCLAIDTATRTSVVTVGRGEPLATSRREVRHRHGSFLLEQVDEVLGTAGVQLGEVAAFAVGTGPGSFTGLRVGLATAKTLAYAAGRPLVGLPSSEALRRAAVAAGGAPDAVVVLPAGAHDHYLVRTAGDPQLVPPGDLLAVLSDEPAMSVDMGVSLLGPQAASLGEAALARLPAALLALAAERLAAGATDVPAVLVPAYVALPRGVRQGPEDLGWSPDLR
jgi:tRNA threonylcarbamoyladenosine biosynthesis protein TsaB